MPVNGDMIKARTRCFANEAYKGNKTPIDFFNSQSSENIICRAMQGQQPARSRKIQILRIVCSSSISINLMVHLRALNKSVLNVKVFLLSKASSLLRTK